LIDENKQLVRRVRDLDQIACRVEAEELLRAASEPPVITGGPNSTTVITKVFGGRDADSLKQLALALIAHANLVALLGSRDGETAQLVFARSSGAPGDMNALMHRACVIIE